MILEAAWRRTKEPGRLVHGLRGRQSDGTGRPTNLARRTRAVSGQVDVKVHHAAASRIACSTDKQWEQKVSLRALARSQAFCKQQLYGLRPCDMRALGSCAWAWQQTSSQQKWKSGRAADESTGSAC
jgi:hypothetical protein